MRASMEQYISNMKRARAEPLVLTSQKKTNSIDSTSMKNENKSENKSENGSKNKRSHEYENENENEAENEKLDKVGNLKRKEMMETREKKEKKDSIDSHNLTLFALYKNSGNCVRLRVNGTLVPSYLLRRYARTFSRGQSSSSFPSSLTNCPPRFPNATTATSTSLPSHSAPSSSSSSSSPSFSTSSAFQTKKSGGNKNENIPIGSFLLESCWALCKYFTVRTFLAFL